MAYWRGFGAALSVVGLSAVLTASAVPAFAASPKQAAAPAASSAQGGERIAAVVNQDAITASDVEARLRLALLGSGLPDNADVRQRLRPQAIRQLIDERLQVQEAKRMGVNIPPAEIEAGIERLAKQNGTTKAGLAGMLSGRNVPMSTMRAQVEAALAWQRVLQRKIRQDVSVSGEEVDAAYDRLKAEIGKPEYLLAEIFLAVDRASQDAEVQRLAQKLSEDLRRGGNFSAIARQFSQSAGAANGGDLGWVRTGDMRSELDTALKTLRPGQLSAPIRSADGYHILLVRAQRTVGSKTVAQAPPPRPRAEPRIDLAKATIHMKQLMFPAAANTDEARNAAKAQAEGARKTIRSCGDFQARAQAVGQGDTADMGTVKLKDMQGQLAKLVASLPVGQPGPVLSGPGGALLLIVCARNIPTIEPPPEAAPPPPPQPVNDARLPAREEVETEIFNQRAEALSRRYLRDLRRAAFIEIR
jgi:peptidyl-prolyl cis-trans isomerase SurA